MIWKSKTALLLAAAVAIAAAAPAAAQDMEVIGDAELVDTTCYHIWQGATVITTCYHTYSNGYWYVTQTRRTIV